MKLKELDSLLPDEAFYKAVQELAVLGVVEKPFMLEGYCDRLLYKLENHLLDKDIIISVCKAFHTNYKFNLKKCALGNWTSTVSLRDDIKQQLNTKIQDTPAEMLTERFNLGFRIFLRILWKDSLYRGLYRLDYLLARLDDKHSCFIFNIIQDYYYIVAQQVLPNEIRIERINNSLYPCIVFKNSEGNPIFPEFDLVKARSEVSTAIIMLKDGDSYYWYMNVFQKYVWAQSGLNFKNPTLSTSYEKNIKTKGILIG